MIIKRKYEWFGALYEKDIKVRALIDEAFELESVSDNLKRELLEGNYHSIPAFMGMGCGIPGKCYVHIMDGLEVLDKEIPYDNELTFGAISRIEYETSRKGTAIQMRFVHESADIPYRIIGFAALDNKTGTIDINKGWEMTKPFID